MALLKSSAIEFLISSHATRAIRISRVGEPFREIRAGTGMRHLPPEIGTLRFLE